MRYGGQEGYVLTNYILPKEESYLSDCLETVVPTSSYSYEQLLADLSALKELHPGAVTAGSIGLTELGREIPVLCIGDPGNAEYHVLLQGAIHGREHLTAWLLMALADYWLDHGILGYGSICYHIIPMANPDGVTISQTAALGSEQQAIYQSDRENGYTAGSPNEYAAQWKANGKGVDINRNFPAGWELIESRSAPSSQQYRGRRAISEWEAAALRDYTLRFDFDATISYHATGSLIYYEYGSRQEANALSLSLGQAVSEVTGYELIDSSGVDGAGYKDWAIDELGIPSLTIEVGCEEAALAEREIASISCAASGCCPPSRSGYSEPDHPGDACGPRPPIKQKRGVNDETSPVRLSGRRLLAGPCGLLQCRRRPLPASFRHGKGGGRFAGKRGLDRKEHSAFRRSAGAGTRLFALCPAGAGLCHVRQFFRPSALRFYRCLFALRHGKKTATGVRGTGRPGPGAEDLGRLPPLGAQEELNGLYPAFLSGEDLSDHNRAGRWISPSSI